MFTPTKTLKRLGVVGAAAAVGLVPIAVTAGTAYAAAGITDATLLLTNQQTSATGVIATTSFSNGTAVTSANSITIVSADSAGAPEALPVTPAGSADFTVTDDNTTVPTADYTLTSNGTDVTITPVAPYTFPAGGTVGVEITGVTNPAAASTVYFTDGDTTADGTANTNSLAISAAAPTAVSGANLSLASTVGSATTTATNYFTTTNEVSATGTITISSYGPAGYSSTDSETLPTQSGVALGQPGTAEDYTVMVNGIDQVGTVTGNGDTAIITLNTAGAAPIPAGTKVTVVIAGVVNPATSTGAYFEDSTSSDTTPVATNAVAISSATVSTPGAVTAVNPTAFLETGGEPFTITGTGFSATTAAAPIVCFVPSANPVPAYASGCTSGAGGSVQATNLTSWSATQIQGVSPDLPLWDGSTTSAPYNIVVYNYDPAAPGFYTTATATSAITLVSSVAGLNFIPESGVRAVSTSTGLGVQSGVASGPIPSGTVRFFPLSDFEQSPTVPTNVPNGVAPDDVLTPTALSLNVTAVAPSTVGNLQVFPTASGSCAAAASTAGSTVNFQAPNDTSNSTIVAITGDDGICVQDNGASVNVDMDVTGYTTGDFTYSNSRLLDSRPGETDQATGTQRLQGPLAGGTVYSVDTTLPVGTEVALNVTVVAPTSVGNLRVFPQPLTGPPAASGVPNTSVVTYIPHTDASSLLVTTVGSPSTAGVAAGFTGAIDLYSDSPGTVNVVVDVVGTFTTGSSLSTLVAPYRLLDTRPGGIAAGGTVTVTAAPSGSGTTGYFIPASAVGVVGTLGDINPTSVGYMAAYPQGTNLPDTSNINNFPGQTRSTTSVVALNPANGEFTIQSVGSATNATFDATGYIS